MMITMEVGVRGRGLVSDGQLGHIRSCGWGWDLVGLYSWGSGLDHSCHWGLISGLVGERGWVQGWGSA